MRRTRIVLLAALLAPLLAGASAGGAASAGALPAQAAVTRPATGTFSFVTGNGVLPTWSLDDLALIGVSPGTVLTSSMGTSARVTLPVVARTGSAIAAGGGFRINNVATGATFRCSTPTIDVRANVVDCVLIGGDALQLFAITSVGQRTRVAGSSTSTDFYRGLTLRVNGQRAADLLNRTLGVSTFSPSVTVGIADLIVTQPR